MDGWKLIGQLQAVILHLAEVCKKAQIDSVIFFAWLVGEGREFLEKEFFPQLVERFKQMRRSYRIDEFTSMVNLDAPLRLPFDGAKLEKKPLGTGWIEVKRVGDKLLIGGREFVLPVVEAQKTGTIHGHELRTEMEKDESANVHPNVMDALVEDYPDLIPDSFKVDEEGKTRFIYLWGAIFRDGHNLCVRYFCFVGARWNRDYNRLARGWDVQDPAARLASAQPSKT